MITMPVQDEGIKNKKYLYGLGIKNGPAAPSIINEETFTKAIPSSLFDENETTNSAMIIPCKVPADDKKIISTAERFEMQNTGSKINVIAKATSAGIKMRETKYPLRPRPVTKRYLSI